MALAVSEKERKNAYNRAYYAKRKSKDGEYYKKTRKAYYKANKKAYAQRSQRWYADSANKIYIREKKHGINFWAMYESQKGLCAIGGEPLSDSLDKIQVDHDHETGLRRGLVCRTHNTGLGMFNDDWELLEKASKYIFNAKVRHINGVSN